MLKLETYVRSDPGKVRTNNEDAFGAAEPRDPQPLNQSGHLYVVADGMGGHQAGEYASHYAVDTLLKAYYRQPYLPPEKRLREIFLEINQGLLEYTKENLQPGDKRIARELHDHTGQALTSQIASLGAMEARTDDPVLRHQLAGLREQVEQTLEEVHDLSVTLRPSVLDDLGLTAALQRHCRGFATRRGVEVNFACEGLDHSRLPAEVELTIYRIVQEALTNALRHGKAGCLSVRVVRVENGVSATIEDDGTGFDATDWRSRCADGGHLGLLGSEERVLLLRGRFRVISHAGRGTSVTAMIPLQGGAP